jgi:hypothetical protein
MKKNEKDHQPVCLSACPPPLKRLVDLDKILHGGGAIEGNRDAVIFNPTASINIK